MAREMKDSGVEWIGEIPKKWSCHSLKVIITQNDGGIWGDDPIDADGEIVLRSTEQTIDGKWNIVSPAKRDLSKISNKIYYLCKKNDLLITKSSGSNLHIGKTTIVDDVIEKTQCYYSNFIQRIRLSQTVFAKYYWYILNSDIARSQFTYMQNTTSGIGNLNAKYIANLIVPEPPIQDQYCIEKYLNVKCAELDNVLQKTRASIEEYKRLKQAVITQAVTKGISGSRKMKDSGNEWVKEIPSDIKISRVGLHYKIILGKMLCANQIDATYTYEPYFCAADIHFEGIAESERKKMWFSPLEKQQYLVRKDDLLVVEGGAGAGGCAVASMQEVPTYIQNSIMIVRPGKSADVRYLKYLIECLVKQGYIDVACNKATIPHFTKDKLANVPFLVFSLQEQKEIAQYLDKKCNDIDAIISYKENYIMEIENYKKSLIYEYVTGKKEVPQKYQV